MAFVRYVFGSYLSLYHLKSALKSFTKFYWADRWHNLDNRAAIVSIMQGLASNREQQYLSAPSRIYPYFIVSDRTHTCNLSYSKKIMYELPHVCLCENKGADHLCEADQHLVFATWIVQVLFFLNPIFSVFSHLLCLYSWVCVGPGQKPKERFCRVAAHYIRMESGCKVIQIV